MFYGDAKARQMARSILPSRRREGARKSLSHIRRQNRHEVRQELRKFLVEGEEPEAFDLTSYPMEKIRQEVRERQDADHLAHFERWAIQVSAHLEDPGGRESYMRKLLPKGIVGSHAMTHLHGYAEFRRDNLVNYRLENLTYKERQRLKLRQEREHYETLLRKVASSPRDLRRFNQAIRHNPVVWKVVQERQIVKEVLPDGRILPRVHYTFRNVQKGPAKAPQLTDVHHIKDFLDTLYLAAGGRQHIVVDTGFPVSRTFIHTRWNNPGSPTYVSEFFSRKQPHPAYHPEWRKSAWAFLDAWAAKKIAEPVVVQER